MASTPYNWEHRRARAAALAALRPGDSCPYCRGLMDAGQYLDFDHYPPLSIPVPIDIERVRRLAHRSCNRRAGQAISAVRRRGQVRGPVRRGLNSQAW